MGNGIIRKSQSAIVMVDHAKKFVMSFDQRKKIMLLNEEDTQRLIGGFFDVHNEVGLGRDEKAYHLALGHWLTEEKIPFDYKPKVPILFEGETVLDLYPDLVVMDKITIELKSFRRDFRDSDFVQLFDYMKVQNHPLGFIVNMGFNRVVWRRFAGWSGQEPQISITGKSDNINPVFDPILESIQKIHTEGHLGYGSRVIEMILHHVLKQSGLKVAFHPNCPSFFRGFHVGTSPLDCLVIEDEVVLAWTALYKQNRFNETRCKSYMESLNIPHGIAINFGREDLQICCINS